MAYGEAIIGCSLEEYYASQEPNYFDKRQAKIMKEIEEELKKQKNSEK